MQSNILQPKQFVHKCQSNDKCYCKSCFLEKFKLLFYYQNVVENLNNQALIVLLLNILIVKKFDKQIYFPEQNSILSFITQ